MSILGGVKNSGSMNGPIFHEFKKQASFFLKEKIKTARLALTDVTPAQLLAEEATNGSPSGPESRTLKMISRAAFEVDDYWRIVDILHKRLERFDRRNWRASYNALIVLEHLLTHGPERVAEEFQCDRDVILQMESFQHIDDKGFNWGMIVRKKSERALNLLEKGPLLKEERDRARKVSRGIEGFGSFCLRTTSSESLPKPFARCNSEPNDKYTDQQEDLFSAPNDNDNSKAENLSPESLITSKENPAPGEAVVLRESKPLLSEHNEEEGSFRIKNRSLTGDYDDHPFGEAEHLTAVSLLQAC